jgi:cell wall-associated NlpC family hydrolase
MELPVWADQYIGWTYREGGRDRPEVDCWGLFRIIQKEQFGRDLPLYGGMAWTREDGPRVASVMQRGIGQQGWHEIAVNEAQAGDGLWLLQGVHPVHVGVVIAPGWMLHIEEGINSTAERFPTLRWPPRKIVGVYRYA